MSSSCYLVTGGAGFIGSNIATALLEAGQRVMVLDDLSSGRRENLDDVLQGIADDPDQTPGRFTFVQSSILDQAALEEALDGVEAVLHQAAIPSVPRSFADPASTLRANVEGTTCLLEACRQHGVRRVVVASSSSVYGNSPTLPKTESMQPDPLSPYALSKLACERLCRIYADVYGLEIVALRYFNVFGPRQDPDSQYAAVVPKFITRMLAGERPVIFGDGEQSRDFTYVANVVVANLLAAGLNADGTAREEGRHTSAEKVEGLVANVACGDRHTLLDLVASINRILGTEIAPEFSDPRTGDVRHSHAAIERVRDHLGYEPSVGFEEGLRRTIRWYQESQDAGSGAFLRNAS